MQKLYNEIVNVINDSEDVSGSSKGNSSKGYNKGSYNTTVNLNQFSEDLTKKSIRWKVRSSNRKK